MTDFSQYQPPGIYIEEEATPLVSVVGVAPAVAAIVGPGVGYRTHTEPVTLTGTATVTLSKRGGSTGTGFEVRAADGTLYAGTDYATATGPGEDAGSDLDNTVTIARSGGSTIASGETVYVTYRYTDAEYYSPARFSDFDDVKDAYGEPLDLTTGAILSPLSLAAKVAFENGASQLVLVPAVGTASSVTRTELANALDVLDSIPDVTVVVPLPVGITGTEASQGDTVGVGQDVESHVVSATTNGNRRVAILGYERTSTVEPETLAAGIDSQRVMLVHPNRLNFYNGFTNTTIEVSGYYLAAGLAGRAVAQRVSEPLTKKEVRGFAGIPGSVLQSMSNAVKNAWSEAGVAVIEQNRLGRLVVRHGVSTDPTNIHTREFSLTRGRDAMVTLVKDTFENSGLVGGIIDEDTPLNVKGVLTGVLERCVAERIIIGYQSVKVRVRPGSDPSVIEVKFQYRPAYPLNYIVISFSVNATTGEVDVIEQIAA